MFRNCYIGIMKSELGKKIESHYLKWQLENGRSSLESFAAYVGTSRGYISQIINGTRTSMSREMALQFATKLHDFEIMDILGYSRPDAEDLLSDFPPEFRDKFLSALSEAREELTKRGMTESSPESKEIIKNAFDKHGLQITLIDSPE